MVDLEQIHGILKERLRESRYVHSLGVQKTAVELAKRYHAPVEKASIAGLVHDCAKGYNKAELLNYAAQFGIILDNVTRKQEELLHAVVGAELAKREFQIEDEEILNAIRFHTTGRANMTLLDKIIYLADYIEPNRKFQGVEALRQQALSDLDKATFMAVNQTIAYIIFQNKLIHHDTISARNSLLMDLEGLRQE
ncbi:bis(5'-nucleosyl)-tetraphosphatase (symmetrical) YqeK [Thermotalea metallivorans]|uniref:bis(5'-nucleosyl)-tetraphosphatase (symmetrical) n=1 Tax=Thermotalea metallivorans TaxID=520762 RepID=A0A140L915_9FIRM|nr:bis(5'-nucleosyl)-tetraphosphatase (symmetrical) YqeK [Thermotalea metallivorans]KXG77040.1 hypothetical protein AN619_05680 [Thermotalea metallivorans]